ncbi:uncharacterized protein LOC133187863 [Saccostrea echinata]|uniref:uncharacterized protein LOC133187863 n=1 Tax=Saccostrea echinata TaxID=191078 RepID=UPI002A804CD5|nr:uncharacterized protein LOC133187863 [Saccostrea echinata]
MKKGLIIVLVIIVILGLCGVIAEDNNGDNMRVIVKRSFLNKLFSKITGKISKVGIGRQNGIYNSGSGRTRSRSRTQQWTRGRGSSSRTTKKTQRSRNRKQYV